MDSHRLDALERITPPLRPGERLVVRHRLPDGSATDVVGWLQQLDPGAVVVTDQRGRSLRIDRAGVVAARRVPTARGGRSPMRTSPEELERIALRGWVAEQEQLGEWTLRAGGGLTGRANSCLAVGDSRVPLAEAAQRVEAYARAHDIPPLVQVVAESEPESGLRRLGWQETYVRTDVLVARLGVLLEGTSPDPRVEIVDHLQPAWEDTYQESRPNTTDPHLRRLLLEGLAPRALAGVRDGEPLFAIGRGQVSQDWLGVASLWTAPERRREGWANRILTTLGHWGARSGARNVYLQVAEENVAAHRTYARRGFSLHHSYRYLAPSDGPRAVVPPAHDR